MVHFTQKGCALRAYKSRGDLQKTYTQEVMGWTLQSLLSATRGMKNSVSSASLKDKQNRYIYYYFFQQQRLSLSVRFACVLDNELTS